MANKKRNTENSTFVMTPDVQSLLGAWQEIMENLSLDGSVSQSEVDGRAATPRNNLIVMPGRTVKSTGIKAALKSKDRRADTACRLYLEELEYPYREEVEECSRITGMSLSEILNESIKEWLETWGAVYMDTAESLFTIS